MGIDDHSKHRSIHLIRNKQSPNLKQPRLDTVEIAIHLLRERLHLNVQLLLDGEEHLFVLVRDKGPAPARW